MPLRVLKGRLEPQWLLCIPPTQSLTPWSFCKRSPPTHLITTPRQSTQPAKPEPQSTAQQLPRTAPSHKRTHLMLGRPPFQFPSEHSVCLRLPLVAPAQLIKLGRSSRCLQQQFKRTEQLHRRLL
jgi:hypothetical protein